MRVVNVAVGFPAASVAVVVIRVYHGGSSWVGGEAMRKECSYRAVKRKSSRSLVESVGRSESVWANKVSIVIAGQPVQNLRVFFRDFLGN